tara:strand:+ start:1956 stop:2474 length:519 start_codon:yes stop_codon:yes gene_type:complete
MVWILSQPIHSIETEIKHQLARQQEPQYHQIWDDRPPSYNECLEYIASKDGDEIVPDFIDAINTNIRPEHREFLTPIVTAIRYAENGGDGKEFGILHPRVKPTYRSQAGWCSATVQKNYDRWNPSGPYDDTPESFIKFLGARYAPIGVDNDPNNLNANWVSNVTYYYNKFTR